MGQKGKLSLTRKFLGGARGGEGGVNLILGERSKTKKYKWVKKRKLKRETPTMEKGVRTLSKRF